jgi:uncharacterized protein DUF6290
MRTCRMCDIDISTRHGKAIYCVCCAKKTHGRLQSEINLRVSVHEYHAFTGLARAEGKSLSEIIRTMLLERITERRSHA